jgi:IS30 family transposase
MGTSSRHLTECDRKVVGCGLIARLGRRTIGKRLGVTPAAVFAGLKREYIAGVALQPRTRPN